MTDRHSRPPKPHAARGCGRGLFAHASLQGEQGNVGTVADFLGLTLCPGCHRSAGMRLALQIVRLIARMKPFLRRYVVIQKPTHFLQAAVIKAGM